MRGAPSHSRSGVYSDIFDGSAHTCAADPTVHLVLYFEEFVVTNPLGNKTRKFSIGAIYYAVASNFDRLQDCVTLSSDDFSFSLCS